MTERLLIDGAVLEARKLEGGIITVCYKDGYVKDGCALRGTLGEGKTIEDAANDYYRKIQGKTIVFHPDSKARREVTLL